MGFKILIDNVLHQARTTVGVHPKTTPNQPEKPQNEPQKLETYKGYCLLLCVLRLPAHAFRFDNPLAVTWVRRVPGLPLFC